MGNNNNEWHGEDRRSTGGWEVYKEKVLGDNQEMKAEIKEIKGVVNKVEVAVMLLQQKVTTSSATTSTITSAVIGVLVAYLMNKVLVHP